MRFIQNARARHRSNFRNQADYRFIYGLLENLSSPICTPEGLISISMVRNELDILPIWLQHLETSFSNSFIFDHLSRPSIAHQLKEWCQKHNRIYVRIDEPAYIQEAIFVACADYVSNVVAYSVPLVPIDADEFLSNKSAQIISSFFRDNSLPMQLKWRNAFPTNLLKEGEVLDANNKISIFRKNSIISKTVIPSDSIRYLGYRWLAGNHLVVDSSGNFLATHSRTNAELLHLPIRSIQQVKDKVLAGNIAYGHLRKFRSRKEMGFHWQDISHVQESIYSSPEFIFNYGTSSTKNAQIKSGFECFELDLETYLKRN